jgi:hypothetical protein
MPVALPNDSGILAYVTCKALKSAGMTASKLLLWNSRQEYEAVNAVGDFAVAHGKSLYCFTADLSDGNQQFWQSRRIIYGNVVGGQEQMKLRCERRDSLDGMDVSVEIGFRTVEPDRRVVEIISSE